MAKAGSEIWEEWVILAKYIFLACLGDEMGLGKTLQAIATLAWLQESEEVSFDPSHYERPILHSLPCIDHAHVNHAHVNHSL